MLLFSHRRFLDGVKTAGKAGVSIAQLKTLATAQGNDHIVSFLENASLQEQVEVKAYLKQGAPKKTKNIPSKLPYAQVGERDFQGMTEVSVYVNDDRVKSIKTDDVDGLVGGYKIDYPSAGVEYADGILTITPVDKRQEAQIFHDIAGIFVEVPAGKKTSALIFGEDRKAIAEDKGNAFGLEGKDRTIASEDQKKIYTPKKVAPTTEDEQRYDFRDRQKIEVWNPTTSDIKAAVGAIAEALKAKPDFPEILGRAEKDPVAKRDEKSGKEKAASKKTASLGEQLDGAKLVKYDPNTQLTFAWFGGSGVNIYDETGYEVDYFSFSDKSTPEDIETMITEKMAEIAKTGSKKQAKLTDADLLQEILDKYNQHRKIWMDNHKGSDEGYDAWFTRQVQGVGTKFSAKSLEAVLSTEWLRLQNEKEKREEDAKKKLQETTSALASKDVKADAPAAVPATAPAVAPAPAAPAAEPAPVQAAKKTAETIELTLGQPMNIVDPSGTDKRVIPTEVDPNTKKITMVPEGTETTTIQQK